MFSNWVASTDVTSERSVYERVLGSAFADLDPQLRTYFGPIPVGFAGFGVGRFGGAGLRVRGLRPLFTLLGARGIAFADYGDEVPFTVRNVSRPDGTLHAVRIFHFPTGDREMTDRMRFRKGRLTDRVGKRGEIEVELVTRVSAGRLTMESRRLAVWMLGLRVPLPRLVTVTLQEDAGSRHDREQHVSLSITAPVLGEIYGYHGTFTYAIERIPT